MNSFQLKILIQTNILYANPQVTQQQREKGKNGKDIMKSIILQYVGMSLLFMVIYGMMMLSVNFVEMPGYFTYYTTLFTIMGFAQSVTVIFNVFYESKDLTSYLPLPFSQNSIFFAKFLIVGMTIIPFVLPILVLFIMTALRGVHFVPLMVLLALVAFTLYLLLVISCCALVVFGLTQTKSFVRHKKVFTTLLMVIPMIGMVGGILYLNSQQVYSMTEIQDQPILWPFYPLHLVMTQPFSLAGLLSFAGLAILLWGAVLIIKSWIIPQLYNTELTVEEKANTAVKRRQGEGLTRQLWRYNFGLIKNPSLMMQIFSSSILLPVIMVLSFALNGMVQFDTISLKFFGVFFAGGILFSLMSLNQTAVAANIISLDRENFFFIRSLPISFISYLKIKFHFSLLFQSLVTGLLVLVGGLLLKVPVLLCISLLAGDLLGTYLGSLRFFARDYKHLTLNWTNVSQLFNRGGGNFALMLTIFGTMLIGALIIVAYALLIATMQLGMLINSIFALLVLVVSGLIIFHYRSGFWKKLQE